MKGKKRDKRYFPFRPLTSDVKEIIKNMPVRIAPSATDFWPAAGIDRETLKEEEMSRWKKRKFHQT